MNSCTLYIVRHGQSISNRDDICAGHLDTSLTKLGEQQANKTKKLLEKVHFDAAYSSDLRRARKTTEIIYDSPVPEAHLLPSLRERKMGRLEGGPEQAWLKLSKDYDDTYGDLPLEERWKHSYAPYVEGNGPLSARFMRTLSTIADTHSGETVLIGTHGGCIRTTLVKLGYIEEAALPPGSFGNASYIVLTCSNGVFEVKNVVGL